MCNKLSFYASHTSSSFLEANNEIESLTMKIEEPFNNTLKGKKLAPDGAISPHQVHDPNIVKSNGNLDKVASHIKKGRLCNWYKMIGHTIQKCLQATIPHISNHHDMVCNIHYAFLVKLLIFYLYLHI